MDQVFGVKMQDKQGFSTQNTIHHQIHNQF